MSSFNGRPVNNETILQCICYLNETASHVLFKRLPGCVEVTAKDPTTKFSKHIRCEDRSLSLADIGFGYDVWSSHSTDDIHKLTPGELRNILAVAGSFVDLKGYTPQGRAMTRRLADFQGRVDDPSMVALVNRFMASRLWARWLGLGHLSWRQRYIACGLCASALPATKIFIQSSPVAEGMKGI